MIVSVPFGCLIRACFNQPIQGVSPCFFGPIGIQDIDSSLEGLLPGSLRASSGTGSRDLLPRRAPGWFRFRLFKTQQQCQKHRAPEVLNQNFGTLHQILYDTVYLWCIYVHYVPKCHTAVCFEFRTWMWQLHLNQVSN